MPNKPQPKGAIRVFYSYSHKDEKLRDLLATHLDLLKRRKVISTWHDRRIGAGDEWAGQIDEHLKTADIILLLVSANFIASKYCYDIELKLAMKRHRAGEARVIPVILRPCDLTGVPFGKLQSLPKDRRPVTKWQNRDDAFTDIANGIRLVAEELKAKRREADVPAATTENAQSPATSNPAASLIPRPPIVGFVARRDKEGRDIVELLNDELVPAKKQLIALWGPGGSGKTTLAAEVIGATKDSFIGRVVWASSLNRSDFNLATLLDEIATQLGREDLRRLAPEPKAAEVAVLVSEPPALVILDNFETVAGEEQASCLDFLAQRAPMPVLITTRGFIDRDDVTNVELAAMELDEAREFLRRLIARTPKSQNFVSLNHDDLIRRCEANPLLLQWVVRQIVLSKTPQTALDYLSQGEGDAAERVFTRSFNLPQLGDDGRTALLALSLFTPSASREALAEVSGFSDDLRRLEKTVESLSSLWLVETTEGNERIFLRGLTRELAKSRLLKNSRADEFRQRYITYFLLYVEQRAKPTPGNLNAIEAEKDNVLSGLDMAHKMHDWNSVITISGALDRFLDMRGHWAEALRSGRQAEEAARETKDEWNVARFIANVAGIRRNRGEYDKAAKAYQKALEIFRTLKKDRDVAACLHQLAWISQDKGNLEDARRLHSESLALRKHIGDRHGVAISMHHLAMLAQSQGELNDAQRLYEESLEITKSLDDQISIAITLHELGRLAMKQGIFEDAWRLYSESLVIKRQLGDLAGIASTLNQLGILAANLGQLKEARKLFDESLEIEKKLGDQKGTALTLGNLGLLAEIEDNKTEAAQLLMEALSIFEKLGSPEAKQARGYLDRVISGHDS